MYMVIFQTFNSRNKAWVKFKFRKGKGGRTFVQFLDVKQRNPTVKFKGVKVASTSKRK